MTTKCDAAILYYSYQFDLQDRETTKIDLQIEKCTTTLISPESPNLPFWTELPAMS